MAYCKRNQVVDAQVNLREMESSLSDLLPKDLALAFKPSLKDATFARIGLGKAGFGVPMKAVLDFRAAHAIAKDALFTPFQIQRIKQELVLEGMTAFSVHSAAMDRTVYLQRPDLGRMLSLESEKQVIQWAALLPTFDVVIVVADGLSAEAVNGHAVPLLRLLIPQLLSAGYTVAPVVLLQQGRVAASDPIGQYMKATLSLLLIGERPGLSSPDSLGAYLTYAPKIGLTDERRNCVSNIRPKGLSIAFAAEKLFYLINAALIKKLSGVDLKDEMGLID